MGVRTEIKEMRDGFLVVAQASVDTYEEALAWAEAFRYVYPDDDTTPPFVDM